MVLRAVREEDRAGIRADHDGDILMFDVPLRFYRGGWMLIWQRGRRFSRPAERPVAFAFHDVEVSCGEDVGFATAVGRVRQY